MSVIVYAVPSTTPVPPALLIGWERYGLIWHGWDGSVWDLRNVAGGVFMTNAGILGLDDPVFQPEVQESPAKSGRWRTDYRIPERSVELPVYIFNDGGSIDWQELYREFRRSFHPLKPGQLEVRSPLGTRTLELYLDSAGDFSYTRDPVFDGWSRYLIRMTAEDPLWKGETVRRRFEAVSPTLFFGVDGNLHIGTSATTATATVDNDGDEAVWVTIGVEATGVGAVNLTISIDGGELDPPTIPQGSVLVINTDPAVGSALLDGVDVDGQVNPWDPRPVPPGQAVPIDLDFSGEGGVYVDVQPRYWRGL